MFDMSWGEIMVIGGVALVVIGPKELPRTLRTVGQMTAKVRRMAGEFQAQFSEAMREADLEDVRKEVEGLNRDVAAATSTAFNPIETIRNEIKSSIDAKPAPASPAGEWSPGQSELTVMPVEEAGPIPHIEPALPEPVSGLNPDAAADISNPEVAPLVPVQLDGASVATADESCIVTGPGLEPVAAPDMPKEARA